MLLDALFYLLFAALQLFWWAVILAVVVQLLIQFGVLDTRNRFVWAVADFLYRVTEPIFRRVRRLMPDLGTVDLAPLVVLLLVTAAQYLVAALQGYMIRGGLYF